MLDIELHCWQRYSLMQLLRCKGPLFIRAQCIFRNICQKLRNLAVSCISLNLYVTSCRFVLTFTWLKF